MERVKSGSYLIALSVLVFGTTTLTGLAGSLGAVGLLSRGFVAVLAVSFVGAAISGFFTGSALAGAAFTALFLTGVVVTCFLATGAGFFISSFLGVVWTFTGAFTAALAAGFATALVFAGVLTFAGGAVVFLAGAFAGVALPAFFGAAAFAEAFVAGLAVVFFAGWAALPDVLDTTFFVAIRFVTLFLRR
jgi:hypothetical protein